MSEEYEDNINNQDDIIEISEEQDAAEFDKLDRELNDEDFSEVISLTEYDGNLTPQRTSSSELVIANYESINTTQIQQAYQTQAKSIISKIIKFLIEAPDVDLNKEQKKYMMEIGKLQISQLADMISLLDINKRMLANIIERVNATMAEDYAAINLYNTLLNQHIKLHREVYTHYKSIPSSMKKMRDDIIIRADDNNDNMDNMNEQTEQNQFNNQKQLIKSIHEKRKKDIDEENRDVV